MRQGGLLSRRKGNYMDKKIAIHTMELWLANLPVTPGHVQHGTRPVVIVSNDVANNFSPIVTAVPLTSNRKAQLCRRTSACAAMALRPPASPSASRSWRWTGRASFAAWARSPIGMTASPTSQLLAEQLGIELQVNLAA